MDLLIHLTLFAYVRLELEERVPSQAPCSSSARIADCGARSYHAQWLTRGPSVSAVLSRHLPNLQPHCHRLPIWNCLVFLLPSHLAPVCAAVSHSLGSYLFWGGWPAASIWSGDGQHLSNLEPWQDQLLFAAPGSHLQKRCASLVSTSESLLWLLPSKILHQPRTLFKQLSEAAEAPRNSLCSLDHWLFWAWR